MASPSPPSWAAGWWSCPVSPLPAPWGSCPRVEVGEPQLGPIPAPPSMSSTGLARAQAGGGRAGRGPRRSGPRSVHRARPRPHPRLRVRPRAPAVPGLGQQLRRPGGEPIWWHGRKAARHFAADGVAEGTGRPHPGRRHPDVHRRRPAPPARPGSGIGVVHRWNAEAGRPPARRHGHPVASSPRPAGRRLPPHRRGPGHRPAGRARPGCSPSASATSSSTAACTRARSPPWPTTPRRPTS